MAAEDLDLKSEAFKRDPLPALARLRQAGPLVRLRLPMVGEVWAATTYESVTTILRDQENFVMEPRPGLISALVEAEQDGKRLSEDELLAMAFLLLLAGHETTVHLISTGVLALLEHDEQRRELVADWSKAPAAVDEVLRYMSPVQMTKMRYAARDMQLFGRDIQRGDVFTALLASANCDPAAFPEPEKFAIDRHPNHHVTFGTGIHVCLGLKLARAEAAIAFEKLFTRFPDVRLSVDSADLKWIGRLGIRAVHSLPLALNDRTAP